MERPRPARGAAERGGSWTPPRESESDDVCALAAHLCGVPFAVVNFLDAGRQWFKREVGLGCDTMPLPVSICRHAIADDYAEFPDLSADS